MKKKVILFSVLFLIFVIAFFISAAADDVSQKAYECLQDKLDEKTCSGLSLEENIFSLLSMGECKDELLALSKTENCFGTGSSCDLNTTAQAIIALNMEGSDTTDYEQWLLSQTSISTGIDWFLQIDIIDSIPAECTIDSSYLVSVGTNQKLTPSGTSSCFSVDGGEYWIKINSNCYNKQFNVSCDEDFSTTLLFRKPGSSVIHLSDNTQFANAGEKIVERINSYCSNKSGSFDYEGTLWAALALELTGEQISSYLPYLIVMAEDTSNSKYLPESFLYYLTGENSFSASLKTKQKESSYWEESGNRFYDTAVALLPFQDEDFAEKTKTINWLESIQNTEGCFADASFKDIAFLFYSIWPNFGSLECETDDDCSSDEECINNICAPKQGCDDSDDCPVVNCKTASCSANVCLYNWVSCQDNDGCCPPSCTFQGDNDCGEPPECTNNSGCDIYDDNSSNYCFLDNAVYQYIYDYNCIDGNCTVNETNNFIKNCSSNETCNKGVCISEPECTKNSDCPGNKICKNGICVDSPAESSCEDNNGYCMSRASCDNIEGDILGEYSCSGLNFCCDREEQEPTDDNGVIGPIGSSLCEDNNGTCRNNCNEDEKESTSYNCSSGKICCMPKKESGLLLVIILIILITLAAVAIVFRKKLSEIFKKKPSAPEKKPSLFPGGFTPRKPRMPSGVPLRGPIPRRILPQKKPGTPIRKSESSDVFQKLKELGR